MPDPPHRFTTKKRDLSRGEKVSWGSGNGWNLADRDGVSIEGDTVVPVTAPTTGLVAHYPFTDGTAADAEGTYDGTLYGPAFDDTGGPNGNGAFTFDGGDDYVDIGNVATSGSFSVAVWCNPASTGTTVRLVTNLDDSASDGSFFFDKGNDDTLRFGMYESGGSPLLNGSSALTAGTWYHVVAVHEAGGSLRLYLDGAVDASTTTSVSHTDNTSAWGIGEEPENLTPEEYWHGTIGSVRIYDRALSDSEVTDLYDATR